jgi:hypothetical protein
VPPEKAADEALILAIAVANHPPVPAQERVVLDEVDGRIAAPHTHEDDLEASTPGRVRDLRQLIVDRS